ATAGIDCNSGSSGAAGISGPALDAAESGLRARPHVYVAVFHARMDSAARGHDGTSGFDPSSASAAGRVCDSDGVDIFVAAGGGANGAGAGGASEPIIAPPVQPGHDGGSRQRSASDRDRRAIDPRTRGGVAAVVGAGGVRAVGIGVVGRALVGDFRLRLWGRGGVRVVGNAWVARTGVAGAGGRRTVIRLHRRNGG